MGRTVRLTVTRTHDPTTGMGVNLREDEWATVEPAALS